MRRVCKSTAPLACWYKGAEAEEHQSKKGPGHDVSGMHAGHDNKQNSQRAHGYGKSAVPKPAKLTMASSSKTPSTKR